MKLSIRRTALSMLIGVIAFNREATSSRAADGLWIATNNGNWNDSTKWSGGTIADGTDFTANFNIQISTNRIVSLIVDRTIGHISFTDTTPTNDLTITGNILTLDVTSGAPTINVTQANRTLTISSQIQGSDGLTKTGPGMLTLSSANSYTGVTTIAATASPTGSQLIANNALALGSTVDGTTVGLNTSLVIGSGLTISGEAVTIDGAGSSAGNIGALVNSPASSPATWAGPVILNGTTPRIGARAGTQLTVSGAVSDGTGASLFLTGESGTGTIILSGANTYTGATNIVRGTIKIGADNSLPVTTVLDVQQAGGDPAVFDLNNFNQTIAGLKRTITVSTSTVTNTGPDLRTLALNTSTNNTYSGTITGANLALTKSGTGTQTLFGANTYAGGTTVSAGTLLASNSPGTSATGTGTVTIGNTATLGGSGFIGGHTTIQAGGTVSPGNSPGTLSYDNANLIWNGNGNYNWQVLNATHTCPVAGTDYDSINITGTGILDLSSLTSSPTFKINLWSLGSLPNNSGNAANWDATQAHSWTLVSTPNAISGFDVSKFTINAGANNGTGGFSNGLSGGSFSVALTDSGTDLSLVFTPAGAATNTTFTLAAAPGTLNILKGGNLAATSTIANTGSGSADTLSYTTLSGTSGNINTATVTGSSNGGPLANGGASAVQNLVINGVNNGNTTITASVATAKNGTLLTDATSSGTAGTINVVVGNASFDDTDSSTTFGTPLSTSVNAGANLINTNLSSNSINASVTGGGPIKVGTTATIVNYSNTETGNANEIVSMAWRSRTAVEANLISNPPALLSDVVRITGMGAANTDAGTFLLTMTYDLDQLQFAGLNENSIAASGELKLGWLNAITSTWVNAVDGNIGGTSFFAGVGAPTGSEALGTWGIDTSGSGGTGYVWAVLNHNSDFAVIPEPSTLAACSLLMLGFAATGLRQWRNRK